MYKKPDHAMGLRSEREGDLPDKEFDEGSGLDSAIKGFSEFFSNNFSQYAEIDGWKIGFLRNGHFISVQA